MIHLGDILSLFGLFVNILAIEEKLFVLFLLGEPFSRLPKALVVNLLARVLLGEFRHFPQGFLQMFPLLFVRLKKKKKKRNVRARFEKRRT